MGGNYGLNTLTVDKVKETLYSDLTPIGYWGPIVEKNGKYYISVLKDTKANYVDIYDAQYSPDFNEQEYYDKYYSVGLVVDKSMSQEELDKLIYNFLLFFFILYYFINIFSCD